MNVNHSIGLTSTGSCDGREPWGADVTRGRLKAQRLTTCDVDGSLPPFVYFVGEDLGVGYGPLGYWTTYLKGREDGNPTSLGGSRKTSHTVLKGCRNLRSMGGPSTELLDGKQPTKGKESARRWTRAVGFSYMNETLGTETRMKTFLSFDLCLNPFFNMNWDVKFKESYKWPSAIYFVKNVRTTELNLIKESVYLM